MEWWQVVSNTIIAEFSDISDIAEMTRITLRLFLAALLGGLLGYERERKGKAAGVKTHMLVALGSALFVLIPEQAGVSDAEISRIIQGVVAGIGFLGAGAIIKGNNDEHITGLTTAAGIWLTAAIGVTVGMGRETSALLCALFGLAIFYLVPHLSRNWDKSGKQGKVQDE
ncbi:MAG TPA: MgtC/SapB family protein [Methylophilaceae bacterium]|nr:MgtC/SapB family protein [Methylophilaceae bacterium]